MGTKKIWVCAVCVKDGETPKTGVFPSEFKPTRRGHTDTTALEGRTLGPLLSAPSLPRSGEAPRRRAAGIPSKKGKTNMEAPRTPLEDLVPFAEAFWDLPR